MTLCELLPHLNSLITFLMNQNSMPRKVFDHGL